MLHVLLPHKKKAATRPPHAGYTAIVGDAGDGADVGRVDVVQDPQNSREFVAPRKISLFPCRQFSSKHSKNDLGLHVHGASTRHAAR